jgi:hypothetical protein
MSKLRPFVLLLLACVLAPAGAIAASAGDPTDPTPTTEPTSPPPAPTLTPQQVQVSIDRYRRRIWYWQRVMGRPVTRTLQDAPTDPLDRIRVWKQLAVRTQTVAQHPPHAREWQCIHRFEGAWTDPNAPYYGGLQMDLGFQRTYGRYLLARKGTANNWTPLEQMWVAEHALRAGRGFYPWPNTARYCGLI